MDFINWIFDKHYILSTLFFSGLSLLWCVYKGLVLRGIICSLILGVLWSGVEE